MTQATPSPSAPIPDRYEPAAVEERWYPEWEKRGYFRADSESTRPPYCIVMPPPNVTGSLHMGHGFTMTLQDILVRTKRMDGFNALWQPGTDHAGIATQVVVERQLAAEGKSKDDLGREAFVRRVWAWKEESGDTIIRQLKKLGASCDWSRLRFTLDDDLIRAVREAFVRLYDEGLIYRDDYIVNWCRAARRCCRSWKSSARSATASSSTSSTAPSRSAPCGRRRSSVTRAWPCTRATSATRSTSAARSTTT